MKTITGRKSKNGAEKAWQQINLNKNLFLLLTTISREGVVFSKEQIKLPRFFLNYTPVIAFVDRTPETHSQH